MSYDRKNNKKFNPMPENRSAALSHLLDTPDNRKMGGSKVEDETTYFQLYLNNAVNNISNLTGLQENLFKETSVHSAFLSMDDEKIRRLANFFWLFNVEEPEKDFKDYRKITIMLAEKIYALRNFFVHPQIQSGVGALLATRDFYVFLEGTLMPAAQDNVLQLGMKTDKLFKLKLLNAHCEKSDVEKMPDKAYEFTRKGLIFLTCLSLYRDEAMEFCSLFNDMRLPEKCRAGIDPEECTMQNCGKAAQKCNTAKAKAYREMFTYFSIRSGRDVLNASELHYMCFADIIAYLNKVPTPAMDYLTLDAERNFLKELEKNSTESDENKEYKYSLHRRFKDRFLSFAAAYCEDFNLLPVLRFKRLDISEHIGRKRYCFGAEHDNKTRLNRHYIINRDTISFEFIPEQHYGPVKIGSLRGRLGENEFKKLLFLGEKFLGFEQVNQSLKEYFAAYHRILESLLNETEPEEVTIYDKTYLQDFSIVTGKTEEELSKNVELAPFFSPNIERFFMGTESKMDQTEMLDALWNRLIAMQNHANDFSYRAKQFRLWLRKEKDKETNKRPPMPSLKNDLNDPPFTAKLSDGEMIRRVFALFNLYLPDERKFRQLSRGEQHNGQKDHEYQLVHRAIGKFTLQQKDFDSLLKKIRPELSAVLDQLQSGVKGKFQAEETYLKKHPRYDAKGNPVRASQTLLMLSETAAELYMAYCEQELKKLENADPYDFSAAELREKCRRAGIRTGMPLDRDSLIKTILNIDLEKWTHAYNYASNTPYVNRKLEDVEHVVVGIPLPGGFADRVVLKGRSNKAWKHLFTEENSFDFNRAIRQSFSGMTRLRNYYDVSPMIGFIYNGCSAPVEGFFDPEKEKLAALAEDRLPRSIDCSRQEVSKALKHLRKIELQDLLLLNMALKYREEFMNQENAVFVEKTKVANDASVYTYFDTPVAITQKEGIRILIYPNDLTRPSCSRFRQKNYAVPVARAIDPARKEFTFYEMQDMLRRIQARDRNKRLELIPLLLKMELKVFLPELKYSADEKANRDMEFPYYKQAYRTLTRADFDVLAEARNAVFHSKIALDTEEAKNILKRLMQKF